MPFDFADPALTTPVSQMPVVADEGTAPAGIPPVGLPVARPRPVYRIGEIPINADPQGLPPPPVLPPAGRALPAGPGAAASTPTAPLGLPDLPGGVPNVPPPAAAGPPGSPVEQAADTLTAATEDQVRARQDLDVQDQMNRLAAADQAEASQRAEAALLEQQQNDRRAADAAIVERQKKFDAAKYHDFWEDKGVGRQIAVGLGIFLGALGPGQTNHASEIVQAAINRDFQRQQKSHENMLKSVELAQAAGRELTSNQLHYLSAFRHLQAAKLDAVVKQGEAMAAHSKNAFGVSELKTELAKLGLEAAKAKEESRRAALAAVEKKRMDDSQIALQRSQIRENNAQAEHTRAGVATRKGAAEDELLAKMGARMYPQQANAVKAVKNLEEAEGLADALRHNPSKLLGQLSKERIVSIFAAGGKPSVTAMNMVAKGASLADMTEDKIMTALTGKEGPGLRKQMLKIIDDEVGKYKREVNAFKSKHDAAFGGFAKRNDAAKAAVEARRAGIFGVEHDEGTEGGRPQGSRHGTFGGKSGWLWPDGTFHAEGG